MGNHYAPTKNHKNQKTRPKNYPDIRSRRKRLPIGASPEFKAALAKAMEKGKEPKQ